LNPEIVRVVNLDILAKLFILPMMIFLFMLGRSFLQNTLHKWSEYVKDVGGGGEFLFKHPQNIFFISLKNIKGAILSSGNKLAVFFFYLFYLIFY